MFRDVPQTPAQLLRKDWSDRTNATFTKNDWADRFEFPAANYEREFDFRECEKIVFLNGELTGAPEDYILETKGTGHMTLPPNVQVLVTAGYAKCTDQRATDGSTVVGSGARAPAPSRAGSSYVESAYTHSSGSPGSMTPPTNVAAFGRASSSYYSSSSAAAPRGADDGFEVVEQAHNFDERIRGSANNAGAMSEVCSISPSESISSVGTRGVRSNAGSQWWN